jgi:hypothetical protein
MDCGHQRQLRVRQYLAAVLGEAKRRAEQRLGSRRPERNEQLRTYRGEFRMQPGQAGPDVFDPGGAVDADCAFSAVAVFAPEPEVFHHIGDIDVGSGHPGPLQRSVEHPTGWADERLTRDVLPIAGLLADQHRRRTGGPRAEDRLRRVSVELTCRAPRCFPTQLG